MSDSQKMNEITDQGKNVPEEWVWTKLGKVCETKSGGTPSRNNKTYYDGTIPWIKSGELKNVIINSAEESITESGLENSSTKIIPKGTLLIALYGATVGKLGILGIDAAINQAICAIYVKKNNSLDQKFLFWYLSSYRNELLNSRIGGDQPNVSQQIVNDVPIPLPSLPEQRLIVSRVDSLLDHVKKANESLGKIPQIMKRFRQAALKKAFSGELTAEWREQQEYLEPAAELLKRIQEERECDYQTNLRQKKAKNLKKQEIELFDTSELTELPEEWVWCNLREITLQTSTKDPRREKDGSFYYVDIEAIDNAKQIINVPRKIENVNAPSRAKRIIKTGDVIFSLVRPYLKNIALIPTELDGQIASTAFYVLRPTKSLYPRFLFNGVRRQSFIDSIITYGDSPPSARDEEFTLLPFPLPPLLEQQEIVRRIESLFKFADETEKNAAEARKRLEIMTQSILARAFRGDLSADFREAVRNWKDLDIEARGRYVFVLSEEERENVLNSDEFPMEPASRLLKRIEDEKEKNGNIGKSRRRKR